MADRYLDPKMLERIFPIEEYRFRTAAHDRAGSYVYDEDWSAARGNSFWYERQTFLKVAFPVNINSDYAACEIQYGAIRRPTHRPTAAGTVLPIRSILINTTGAAQARYSTPGN